MRIWHTLLAIIFGFFAALAASGLYVVAKEMWSVRDSPLVASLADAVALKKSGRSAWVQFTDANADCSRYVVFDSRVDDGANSVARKSSSFIAFNAAKDTEIAVTAHDVGSCAHLGRVHFIGVIKVMDDNQRLRFAADGLAISDSTGPKWWLCTWCVPAHDWGGRFSQAVISGVLLLAMAYTTLMFWRGRKPPAPVTITADVSPPASPARTGRAKRRKRKRSP